VVRKFHAASETFKPDELGSLFVDNGVFIRGTLEVHRGAQGIKSEYERQAALGFDNLTIGLVKIASITGTRSTPCVRKFGRHRVRIVFAG
jgi:hypothetical protein